MILALLEGYYHHDAVHLATGQLYLKVKDRVVYMFR